MIGFNKKKPENEEQSRAWDRRRQEQLQRMRQAADQAFNFCMTAEIRRLEAKRLAAEAAADRAEGFRMAEDALSREVQLCHEAEGLARHPEQALLPPRKRFSHATVLSEQLYIAQSELHDVCRENCTDARRPGD